MISFSEIVINADIPVEVIMEADGDSCGSRPVFGFYEMNKYRKCADMDQYSKIIRRLSSVGHSSLINIALQYQSLMGTHTIYHQSNHDRPLSRTCKSW